MRPLSFICYAILAACTFAEDISEAPSNPPMGNLKKVAPGILELGGIQLDTIKHEVRFEAEINQIKNIVEYAIVHENGKTHESLLRTKISPYQLQVLLLLAKAQKFQESLPEFDAEGREVPPPTPRPKHRIGISVQDLRKSDNPIIPLGDWVANLEDGKPMRAEPWMYTGSRVYEGRFLAEEDGDIVAIYLNPVALFNSWIPGNNNDETWIPRPEIVPPVGTPVRVTFKFPK